MNSGKLESILAQLSTAQNSGDFVQEQYAIVEALERLEQPENAIAPIINFIAQNEHLDFGLPGPLVHFLESQRGTEYVELLVNSIRKRPTLHTLWMLNRIANGATAEVQGRLSEVLRQVAEREHISEACRKAALEFLRFRHER